MANWPTIPSACHLPASGRDRVACNLLAAAKPHLIVHLPQFAMDELHRCTLPLVLIRPRARRLAALLLAAALAALPGRADPSGEVANPKLQHAVMARIDTGYAVVVSADGARSLLPLKELSPGDRAWLERLAAEHPLAHGNSKVVTVATTDVEKKTIVSTKTEGAIETVQLCPPNVFRNQTASFCALYARIHWLDIAGYYVKMGDV